MRARFALGFALFAALCAFGQAHGRPNVGFIPFVEARPIFEGLASPVPEFFRAMSMEERARAWPKWVAERDRQIRARLLQGEEDTLTNFLLFGTSFTRRPRITLAMLDRARAKPEEAVNSESAFGALLRARAEDLLAAAATPRSRSSERLEFAKAVITRNGFSLATPEGRSKAQDYMVQHYLQVTREYDRYAELLKAVHSEGNQEKEALTRSTLFESRGVSLDTSWQPNFAIEQTLASMKGGGLLAAKSVRHVAVIGPGLDFTDKEEGYDFYPPQTIQPFAVFDSLVRLELARADTLEIVTMDLSTRVNSHVEAARRRAEGGIPYTIQLTIDPAVKWKPDARGYWDEWGGRIGAATAPLKPPADAGSVETRALKVQPEIVRRIRPLDLDVVLERLDVKEAGEPFDLVIATNVLVYYSSFEQGLALQNIGSMLRPGGFFLSNDASVQMPGCVLHSVNTSGVSYSDRKEDADYMIWYQKAPAR